MSSENTTEHIYDSDEIDSIMNVADNHMILSKNDSFYTVQLKGKFVTNNNINDDIAMLKTSNALMETKLTENTPAEEISDVHIDNSLPQIDNSLPQIDSDITVQNNPILNIRDNGEFSNNSDIDSKVIDNTIIKQQMRDHSYWLQTNSEEEFMRHYNKGHNILLNTAQYINQDLIMGCAECKTCGMAWNTYTLDNSFARVKLPLHQPPMYVKSESGSIFDYNRKSSLDVVDFSKNTNTDSNSHKGTRNSQKRTNQTTVERDQVKIKII